MKYIEERLFNEAHSWAYETNVKVLERRYKEALTRHGMYCPHNDDLKIMLRRSYLLQKEKIEDIHC